MLPRRTGAPPLSTPELVLLSVALLSVPLCLGLGVSAPRSSPIAWCCSPSAATRCALCVGPNRSSRRYHRSSGFQQVFSRILRRALVVYLAAVERAAVDVWPGQTARSTGTDPRLVLGLAPMLAPMLWTEMRRRRRDTQQRSAPNRPGAQWRSLPALCWSRAARFQRDSCSAESSARRCCGG